MKITINTEVLQKENLSLGEFLVLLMGFYDISYTKSLEKVLKKKAVLPDVFHRLEVVMSDNAKDYVARILTESDDKIIHSNIDFTDLAGKLQAIYPKGNKPGTTYFWRGWTKEITQKLMTLVAKYDFSFTEEEAIKATREYVNSFEDRKKMMVLKNFILKTNTNNQEMESMFMTIIENNR